MAADNLMTEGDPEGMAAATRIYHAWDDALGARDLDAAMALYAPDAVLESPLVRHLLSSEAGVVQGQADLRAFVEQVFARTPPLRQRHRSGFFSNGRRLMWEYPRQTADGEQMDLVEVMDLENGLIRRHCVYWGWLAVKVLDEDGYRPG